MPSGTHAGGIRATGGGFSILSIEEVIHIPSRNIAFAARHLKVVRLTEKPSSRIQAVATLDQTSRGKLPPPSTTVGNGGERVSQKSNQPPTECLRNGKRVGLRSVGEVVRDGTGRLFEVRGTQLRALGELVRDEHGRVFEVEHPIDDHRRGATSAPITAASIKAEPTECSHPGASRTEMKVALESNPKRNDNAKPQSPVRAEAENETGYRKILTDPGLYLEIPFSRVKSEIAPQLKHPERLNDNELIECYAQIYEVQQTMPIAVMSAAELGDGCLHWQFHPLTKGKAEMLGVPQLFRPTRQPVETQTSTRQIYAGQRVYRLWPVFDSTLVRETYSDSRSPTIKNAPILRSEIPKQYLNRQHFKYLREEVLYDMRGALGTLAPEAGAFACWFLIYPMRMLRTLGNSILSKRRMKKWRAMLKGKEADQQLWAVTPPRGFSYNIAARRWAENTLSQAGYDARRMVLEWEIFWRRKGVA